MSEGFFFTLNLRHNFKNKKIMKIEWGTVVAILIALVVYKVVDKFALSKIEALNLEETI